MSVYTKQETMKSYEKGERLKFLFFWGHTPPKDGKINESCFSQWWMCNFEVEGVTYCCAEQYMMAEKARLFHDVSMEKEIMNAMHPKQMKEFGRSVQHFDSVLWDKICYDTVKKGNMAKFSQNNELWEFLKQSKGRILVEASPMDRIWGIGMGKDNPDVENPLKWRGKNLLGFALTEVRDKLLQKN